MVAALSLGNYWHPIATSKEVTAQPKQFTLLGERIVAFRHNDHLAAFKDLCIHRGSALSRGSVKDGRLVCPYHGWAYDLSGACVRIPSLPAGAPIPKKARAIAYAVREAYDLIWVGLREPLQPFPIWPEDAWNRPDYRVFLVNQYLWKTSAGRVVENAMDFSHFNFVHAGYTELADGPVIKPYEITATPRGFSYSYDDSRLRRDYSLDFPFIVHDCKNVMNVGGNGGTWSESANTRVGDATILSFIASPVDQKTTKIYVFAARNHSLDMEDSKFAADFDTVTEQDRVVVETQRPEEIPTDIREELHLRFPDAAAIAYRRLLGELEQIDAFMP
jgi:phenylpropionate dioxygenase-like ring-hydroxylating dioxygenase large terminal subunit